ncbi:MAG: beta galactosidase jelly roll domain-containing protein, partial [Acidobacteriaceae bacterium]|nr:beta galactosidase jelly roll domain-containing protein [Acidobacteriaceae bacterium]
MDRRDFLLQSGTLLAGAALAPGSLAMSGSNQAEEPQQSRMLLPINRNWRYSPSVVDGGHAVAFDDSSFDRVVIPHTNRSLPWHSFDEKSYEFISLYRRPFKLPPEAKGKRIFVDFEGVMTASTVWINGQKLGEYKGGYTPFSFELTPNINWDGSNLLAVDVDSTERPDIPPFGFEVDYLTFGGIYREVWLRVVPSTYIENIFAMPKNVLNDQRTLEVRCFLEGPASEWNRSRTLEVELLDGDRVIGKASEKVTGPAPAPGQPALQAVTLSNLGAIRLWDLQHPELYHVRVRLIEQGKLVDEDTRRFGFREAAFTDQGFSLNGKVIKLRGLDRHQTFPFVGQAMPGRVQRRDALILRQQLKCNIVRTSHYPQSRHFLDACDEIGLLVLEEIPGWQHIGDKAWQDIA